jgi:nucleoside-diphosphate-sugar epimerase
MIDNYVTGSSGFLGKRLMSKLEGNTVAIPHLELNHYYIQRHHRFFWLGTYGNMVGQDNQFTLWQSNILDLVNVLDRIMQFKPYAPFLFMSFSSVNLPVQTPYSRTKRAIEEILLSLKTFPACIIRPFSVVGVGEQPSHLIPTLIRSCMKGTPMDFIPDATHDWIDVDDVVNGMLILSKSGARGIHEFGNRVAVTNEEVRQLVQEITGKKANITNIKQLRDYDNPDWCCKTECEYWQPTKSLRTSIIEMVTQYQHECRI